MRVVVGIDVGAAALHCVALDGAGRVADAWVVAAAGELEELPGLLAGAGVLAIDAPAQTSTLPHDGDPRLSPKFRAARCAEVALGREHGVWVPWVAPAARPPGGWMATGLAAYDALTSLGVPLLEVFPYAGYRSLDPARPLPKKTTLAGSRARVELLARRGIREPRLALWSHDSLDALLAALVALDHANGRARRVGCGHDDSAIWLPAAL